MSNRSLKQPLVADIGMVLVPGVLTIATGNYGVTADSITFVSASRTAVGTYTLTFEDAFVSDKGMFLQVYNTGSQALVPVMSSSNVGSKTATFFLQQLSASGVGGAVGVNRDPQNQISVAFLAMLKNSAV